MSALPPRNHRSGAAQSVKGQSFIDDSWGFPGSFILPLQWLPLVGQCSFAKTI